MIYDIRMLFSNDGYRCIFGELHKYQIYKFKYHEHIMALTDQVKPDDWKKLSFLPIKLCGSTSCSCANCPSATCVLQWPGSWRRKSPLEGLTDGFPNKAKNLNPVITLLSWYIMVTWCCRIMIYAQKKNMPLVFWSLCDWRRSVMKKYASFRESSLSSDTSKQMK